MGFTNIWVWVVILVIVLVLFGGRGKISGLMGDVGKGLRSFREGMDPGETRKVKSGSADNDKDKSGKDG